MNGRFSVRLMACVCLSAALLCGLVPLIARAGDIFAEESVKAAFLYRFTGYVEWPPEALPHSAFTFAVIDADAVADELEHFLTDHLVKNMNARVIRAKTPQEASEAQIVYVGPAYDGDLPALVRALSFRPVLVVTDHDGGLDAGSAVNFLIDDRHVRFEISLAAAERAGLKVSPPLLSVAARVRGAPRSSEPCVLRLPGFDLTCERMVAGL